MKWTYFILQSIWLHCKTLHWYAKHHLLITKNHHQQLLLINKLTFLYKCSAAFIAAFDAAIENNTKWIKINNKSVERKKKLNITQLNTKSNNFLNEYN